MTSFVPLGNRPVISARFRNFPNYSLKKQGVGEKKYNRACSRLCCTGILTGVFWSAINAPFDDTHLPGEIPGIMIFVQFELLESPVEKPFCQKFNRLPEPFRPMGYLRKNPEGIQKFPMEKN